MELALIAAVLIWEAEVLEGDDIYPHTDREGYKTRAAVSEYVNAMQNENFLARKSEWAKVKESKLKKFEDTIMDDRIPVTDKETIIRIAEICFVRDDAEFGEFLKAVIG